MANPPTTVAASNAADRAATDMAAIIKDAALFALVTFGLCFPIVAFRTDLSQTSALDLVPLTRAWLREQPAFGGAGDLRVGVHHGTVVVSRLGADDHQQITATGDCVNLASRLMEVGKELRAALVVSDDLLTAAGHEAATAAELEGRRTVAIRGRAEGLSVAYRWSRGDAPPC